MHNLCTIWVESGNRHPHILPFLGFCHNFGHLPALVYDFCDNGSIRQYLQFNPSADKLQLTLEAASGLAFLHSKKIIHADIRAANILINDKGQACIHDVGLALVIGQSDFTSASIAGPCRWMPPDVLLAGGDESDPLMGYSVWSDIWAFGMTILEVYTGEVPFSDTRHDAAVIRKIIQDVRPPRPSADLMGNEMWNICETCWNKTPEARPTMEALGKWLLELR
ncbi:kinase-like protein [Rickenella mellea]|uniref:Kinase-like protein n=1 Tax=Rickenella mellea TaxID=50990 RepID=A0A4Y7Q8C7_9AGAM|nr:kinase-like protein [Rickenella mellea]